VVRVHPRYTHWGPDEHNCCCCAGAERERRRCRTSNGVSIAVKSRHATMTTSQRRHSRERGSKSHVVSFMEGVTVDIVAGGEARSAHARERRRVRSPEQRD
jgi:hypothetical protein